MLNTQSYTMRNGVLGVIGEVVGQVLNSPEMDEQAKCTRDQLLDKLEVSVCVCVCVCGWEGRGSACVRIRCRGGRCWNHLLDTLDVE